MELWAKDCEWPEDVKDNVMCVCDHGGKSCLNALELPNAQSGVNHINSLENFPYKQEPQGHLCLMLSQIFLIANVLFSFLLRTWL